MATATRSERETVRPFVNIEEMDSALEDVRLLVEGDEFETGYVVLDPALLTDSKIQLRLPEVGALRIAAQKSNLEPGTCGLVVLATSRTHRAAQVLLNETIAEAEYPVEYQLKRAVADLILNDQNGFTLTVAVVLLQELDSEPLRPRLAGTWLARRVFTVSPEKDDTSFSPEELTDAIRDQFKIPKTTLRYVAVDDVLGADAIGDAVHVYVDGEVLNLLLANPTEPLAVQMQIELAIQAMAVVAQTIVDELSEALEHHPTETDLGAYEAPRRFLENLATTLEQSIDNVIEMAESSPERLHAFLEAAFGIHNATLAALKEK